MLGEGFEPRREGNTNLPAILKRSLDNGSGAKTEELLTALQQRGLDREKAEKSIEKLIEKNVIFEPGFGRIKAV